MTRPEKPGSGIPSSPSRTVTLQQSIRIGLLPDPVEFAHYDQILPGGAERIMCLAEAQAAHVQSRERALLAAEIAALQASARMRRRGQSLAFAIGLATLATSSGPRSPDTTAWRLRLLWARWPEPSRRSSEIASWEQSAMARKA